MYLSKVSAYILKAGFAGFQKPQNILNFPQTDLLRTQKLSILQCVLEIKTKIITNLITNYHQVSPKLLIFTLLLQNFIGVIYALFLQIF